MMLSEAKADRNSRLRNSVQRSNLEDVQGFALFAPPDPGENRRSPEHSWIDTGRLQDLDDTDDPRPS